MVHNLYLTEVLQREVEIEAESVEEALDKLEEQYNESEIVLDYSDLKSTEFTDSEMSKKEILIMGEIGGFCETCNLLSHCVEGDCIVFRIEKIIEDGFYHEV